MALTAFVLITWFLMAARTAESDKVDETATEQEA
jgi:hypothetical protein